MCLIHCTYCKFSGLVERKWKIVIIGQTISKVERDRTQSANFFSNGPYVGHCRRISTIAAF